MAEISFYPIGGQVSEASIRHILSTVCRSAKFQILKKHSVGTGPRSVLGPSYEEGLVKYIYNLWVRGFPLAWWSVKSIA